MENKIKISLKVNHKFDSLYKLGYFLIDINSIVTFCSKINMQTAEEGKKQKKYRLGITSRYFNKDSIDDIKIEKFQQGSLVLELICGIIVGVIVTIIGKYINKDENQDKMEVTIINNPKIVNIIENNYINKVPLDENINKIINELYKENIIMENGLLYDEDGKKIIIKNIDRIKGQIINNKW